MSRFSPSSAYARLFILIAVVAGVYSQSLTVTVVTIAFLSICVALGAIAVAGDRHGTRIRSTNNTASVLD